MFCGYTTAGQDVFLEYRRHAKSSWSGSARDPKACYFFAIFLLSFCYLFAISGAFEPFGCSPFAIFLLLFCYRTATPLFLRSINKAR